MSKKKKPDNILGLAPPRDGFQLGTNGHLPSLESIAADLGLSEDDHRVVGEWRKQTLVILGQELKTAFAQDKVKDLWTNSQGALYEGVKDIFTIKESAKGEEYQFVLDEFTTHVIQNLAQELSNITRAGSYGIAVEVKRSLYPPDEQEEPISIWKLLFG